MGLNSQKRADEKVDLIIKSVYTNLGYVANGTTIGQPSKYKGLGSNEGCLLFVHEDKRAGSRWGFAYKKFEKNVIVYYMQNMQLAANSYNPNQQQNNNSLQNNQQPQTQQTKQPYWQSIDNKSTWGFARVRSRDGSYFNYMNQNKQIVLPKLKFLSVSPIQKGGRKFDGYNDFSNIVWAEVTVDTVGNKRTLMLSPKVILESKQDSIRRLNETAISFLKKVVKHHVPEKKDNSIYISGLRNILNSRKGVI